MKIYNSLEITSIPSTIMMIYGEGGVGKTTFASTAPKPILADCENGTKYLGLRGVSLDIAQIEKWSDVRDFLDTIKTSSYETIVIDPIGELMDKLKKFMISSGDSKLVQKDGNPTMAGWGWMKKTMKDFIKVLRDLNKNVILIAHLDESKDEDRIVKRPKIETKIADDIVALVDVVGYMTVINQDGETKRVIIVDPGSDKYTAKDRTGTLDRIMKPDFKEFQAYIAKNTRKTVSKQDSAANSQKTAVKEPVTEKENLSEFSRESISEPREIIPTKLDEAINKLKTYGKSNGASDPMSL